MSGDDLIWLGLRVAFGFAIGAAAGSFGANTAIRMERPESNLFGRSHCDGCGRILSAWETLPIIGYSFCRGKCRTCGARISPFHLVGEIGGALLGALIAVLRPWPWGVVEIAIGLLLWGLSLIDYKTMRLPNSGAGLVALCGLILAYRAGALGLNLGVGIAVFLAMMALGFTLKHAKGRTALGLGDIKLMGALSLWLGPNIVLCLGLGAFLGLVQMGLFRSKPGEAIAFGPALSLAALIIGLFITPHWSLLSGNLSNV